MNTKINNRLGFLIAFTLFFGVTYSQKVSVYNIDDLFLFVFEIPKSVLLVF